MTDSTQNKAAVFFDLDRTLIAGSAAFEFARVARRAGWITRRQLVADAFTNIRFRLKGVSDAGAEELMSRVQRVISGIHTRDLKRLAPEILAGVLPRIYPKMLALAYEHQDAGRQIYICTASFQEIAELLAEILDFDGGIGTVSGTDEDGFYIGQLVGPFTYGEGKAEAIRTLAAKERIDLAESYAYSDSVSDLPMLKIVGNAVVVNPDRELLLIAKESSWQILRFEKLGQRIKIAVAALVTAVVGSAGGVVIARRRPGEPRAQEQVVQRSFMRKVAKLKR